MSKQVLDSITIDNTGDGGSFSETYDAVIMEDPSLENDVNQVSVARGFDVPRGYRKSISGRIFDPSAFAGTGSDDSLIEDVMEPGYDVEFTLTWLDGSTSVLSGAKLTALPIMDAVPDNVDVWYDTDTAATDNPDTDSDSSWTKLAEVLGGTEHEAENVTVADGRDLPSFVYSMFMHEVEMFYDGTAFSNLKTEQQAQPGGNEVRIAIENQAGNYRIYGTGNGDGVFVRVRDNAGMAPDDVHGMTMTVVQSGGLTDIITYPTGAEDYFYGVEFEAEAFGHQEGDIWTDNR